MIVSGVVALCVPRAREFPLDLINLLVFILSFSYLISFTCSALVDSTDGPIVPIAVGITIGVTIALTLYAFFCKGNFLIWIGVIIVVSLTASIVAIVSIFTYSNTLVMIYCGLVVVIYGIYLVIITKFIIGGDYPEFPMDNYILASLFLYIYIMKMFLYILMIVARSKK
jgi:FtsH-binding integral membrane protein